MRINAINNYNKIPFKSNKNNIKNNITKNLSGMAVAGVLLLVPSCTPEVIPEKKSGTTIQIDTTMNVINDTLYIDIGGKNASKCN